MRRSLLLMFLLAAGCGPKVQTVPGTVRAEELFAHPTWVGREVHVDIYDPLAGSHRSSGARAGEYEVEVADSGPARLALAAADGKPLPANLEPPLRVTGVVQFGSREGNLRLLASKIESFGFPAPTKIEHAEDILLDRARWSGAMVTFEGEWLSGFEQSYVGPHIWLTFYPGAKLFCAPDESIRRESRTSHRVRVIGLAHTQGCYGHMCGGEGEIIATQLVYLNPTRPECR